MPETEVLIEARQTMQRLVESGNGLLLEDKGSSLALHYRQNPEKEALVKTELESLVKKIYPGFALQPGKMVAELRPAVADKGIAIEKFMATQLFAGRDPLFIGDDLTDEHGFTVVNDLGGYSVRVGPKSSQTAAQFELPDVPAVREWLVSICNR